MSPTRHRGEESVERAVDDASVTLMDPSLYTEHATLQQRHWWFEGRRRIVEAVLDRHLGGATGAILDAGCGTGAMLEMLAARGDVRGIEPEPGAVAWCRAHLAHIPVEVGTVPASVPADGSLDLVTAFDVIEHIADDRAAMGAFAAAVRPGGHVLVTVPALRWLWSEHDERNRHHRRYQRADLTALVEGAGLELVHRSYFNSLLFPLAAGRRILGRFTEAGPDSDLFLPRPIINRTLGAVFGAERHLLPRRSLPVGVSLLALARRPR